jgi:hypothetical protein
MRLKLYSVFYIDNCFVPQNYIATKLLLVNNDSFMKAISDSLRPRALWQL